MLNATLRSTEIIDEKLITELTLKAWTFSHDLIVILVHNLFYGQLFLGCYESEWYRPNQDN